MGNESAQSYASVKERLDEIVEAVGDENISLDDALSLYEEAIQLGLQVSNLLEEDISEEQAASLLEEQTDEGGLDDDPLMSRGISESDTDVEASGKDMTPLP